MKRDEKGRFLPKSPMSIKEATLWVYNTQPTIFHGVTFVIDVRIFLNRPMCPDGSIFRELRFLRDKDEVIDYRIKSRELSIYEKLERK